MGGIRFDQEGCKHSGEKFHGLKLYLFAEGMVIGLSRFVDGYIRSTMTFSIFRLVQPQKSLKTPESEK